MWGYTLVRSPVWPRTRWQYTEHFLKKLKPVLVFFILTFYAHFIHFFLSPDHSCLSCIHQPIGGLIRWVKTMVSHVLRHFSLLTKSAIKCYFVFPCRVTNGMGKQKDKGFWRRELVWELRNNRTIIGARHSDRWLQTLDLHSVQALSDCRYVLL